MNSQWLNLKSESLLDHFGLGREPFNITPDPGFLYLSASHQQALARLLYGIDARKGFIVLTGEVGTGKTTLIHTLARELEKRNTHRMLIFNTVGESKDLLRDVCEDLGFTAFREDRQNIHTYMKLVNQLLLESYHQGKNVTLIIDEAQNLSPKVLESIRLLSNFETSEDKLLQIVMAGQPELAVRLNLPSLRQLKQRVVFYHHLKPLNFAECAEYIAKRIEIAGGSSSMIFTPTALEAIYTASGGIPRLVNILCDNGMLTAYSQDEKKVSSAVIREIAQDRSLEYAAEEAARVTGNGRTAERRADSRRREADRTEAPEDTAEVERLQARAAPPTRPPEAAPDRLTELIDRLQRERRLRISDEIFPDDGVENGAAEQPGAGAPMADSSAAAAVDASAATDAADFDGESLEISDEPSSSANDSAAETAIADVPRAGNGDVLSPAFLHAMIGSLTEAMGPMAPLVLHDQVYALGEDFEAFPKSRLLELVESASREILEEPLRYRFQQIMSQEFKR